MKYSICKRALVVFFGVVFAGATFAVDWQTQAVQMYPELGVPDSPFNKKFWSLYRQHELGDPNFKKSPRWPVDLAKECAAALAAEAAQKAAPPPAPAAPVAEDAGKKILIAKCGRCHEAPSPTVEEMTWNRWMFKWKDRAQLTDDDYDKIMEYARKCREERMAKLLKKTTGVQQASLSSTQTVDPTPPTATPQEDPDKKLYIAKCGTCHPAYPPGGFGEIKWARWMNSMRGKAHLTDDEYSQLMEYARKKREGGR